MSGARGRGRGCKQHLDRSTVLERRRCNGAQPPARRRPLAYGCLGSRRPAPTAAISAYEVLDALLLRLADPAMFPDLKDIVLAGHSGGGQAVQRYAVVGKAVAEIATKGIHLRLVIANPSSYLYFSEDRPESHGIGCSNWDRWKYGTRGAPDYVKLTRAHGWAEMEDDYARADVIYLMGDEDTEGSRRTWIFRFIPPGHLHHVAPS